MEGFLSHLNHLPKLAIIVTMRGTQRPSGVSWSRPLLPPLEKLVSVTAKAISSHPASQTADIPMRVPVEKKTPLTIAMTEGTDTTAEQSRRGSSSVFTRNLLRSFSWMDQKLMFPSFAHSVACPASDVAPGNWQVHPDQKIYRSMHGTA